MMKYIILLILTINLTTTIYTQDNYIHLFGSSYLETGKYGSDKMIRVKKQISITYNSNYCSIFIEGLGLTSFPTRGYRVDIIGDYRRTSFINQETNIIPDGKYDVSIDEGNGEIIFQINLPSYPNDKIYPNGFTYYVDKVEKFSQNGLVKGRLSIKELDSLKISTRITDSINKVNELKREEEIRKKIYDDSLYLIEKEKSKKDSEHNKLLLGNNYNPVNLNWISDTIVNRINLEENEVFYSNFKVTIDENGMITTIVPDGKGYTIEKYLKIISDIIIGKKVKPFQSNLNFKNYPSYSNVRIGLYHDPSKSKKKRKSLF